MLKYIFKNLDRFLESFRIEVSDFFIEKSLQGAKAKPAPLDILEMEIAKQEQNLTQKENIHTKHEIRRKVLYLHLKKRALGSTNSYIKRAENILKDEVGESAYDALAYLKRLPSNLPVETFVEVELYKALIFEILEDFDAASAEYKETLKKDKTSQTLIAYKEFVIRSRELISWHTKSKDRLRNSIYNMHKSIAIDDMPAIAKRLQTIAKYYARSPKSRSLGRSYYNETLKIYKKLLEFDSRQYSCVYIEALLDGVEIFMMPTFLLKEAQELLLNSRDCTDIRVYLLDRIKELKQRDFIQRSLCKGE